MEDVPLYNSRVMKLYTEYVEKYYPEVDIGRMLSDLNIFDYELEDEGHWFTQKQHDQFHALMIKNTGKPDIAREVGRYIALSKAYGILRQYVAGFFTPTLAYWMLEKLGATLTRHTVFKVNKLDSNSVEILATPKPGVKEKPYQCENRIGTFEALATVFTKEYAHVEHTDCIHRGGDFCRYIVTWSKAPFIIWKHIASYFSLVSFLVCVVSLFILPTAHWLTLVLSSLSLTLGFFLYSSQLEKKDLTANIEGKASAADRLIDQINLRYNEALLTQEIGEAASSILDIDQLLKYIMETLEKRLDFDRGMIMLANKNKTHLMYSVGYGFNADLKEYIENISFSLDNPDSRGEFVTAFREQQPFLVDDMKKIEKNLSAKTLEFAKIMGSHSFICVPIVYEGKSEGILAVDNVHLKRPFSKSDLNLLMGIAPQIGISINNARTYHKILESEERFRALSENSPDIIYTLGIDGSFTYVNPSWTKILGHEKEEVIGKSLIDFAREGDVQTYLQLFRRIRDNKETVTNFNGVLSHKNGAELLFTMSGAPNFDSEGIYSGLVGTLKDITEKRTLEDQLHHASKMEAIGTLTGGIAHDFNNIIQAISGYNQLLMMKKNSDDPDWKYLSNIDDLSQRSSTLIQQLMIFSRKMDSQLQPVELNHEVMKVFDLLKNTIPKMISIDLHLNDTIDIISGDPGQIGQIIMNIAVNAKDVMPDGGRLTIKTENITISNDYQQRSFHINAGSYVRMSLSDTGSGMDEEVIEHIFEPFFTTKEAGKGTGLGLSVVYGIVKNHGGYIICESNPGQGTTFQIYFPTLQPKYLEGKSEPLHEEDLPVGNETILLVDDENTLLETSEAILSQFGYRILTAESGEDALAIYRNNPNSIDLIMLDLIMPGMGGQKCLLELIKINPAAKVIITSGYTSSIASQNILKCGAARFISKPISIPALLKEIRSVLD